MAKNIWSISNALMKIVDIPILILYYLVVGIEYIISTLTVGLVRILSYIDDERNFLFNKIN